jgi:hypothetical protein
MNLQYLETLKSLGQSPSTKWIMPLELTSLIQPFTALAQRAGQMPDPLPAAHPKGNANPQSLPNPGNRVAPARGVPQPRPVNSGMPVNPLPPTSR